MELETVLIYVTSACVGGFIFLLGWVMKLHGLVEKRATYEWCDDRLVMKDVLAVTLKGIKESIVRIEGSVKKIADNGNNK